jgi:hypothetical protein
MVAQKVSAMTVTDDIRSNDTSNHNIRGQIQSILRDGLLFLSREDGCYN